MLKFIKNRSRTITLIVLLVLLGGIVTYGLDSYEDASIEIQKEEVIDGDFIRGLNQIVNRGTVSGDLIIAGNEVKHEGAVEGDLISAAADISVDGPVKGDLRLAADDIVITGEVSRNATMFAGSVLLEEGGIIDGSIHVFAGDLNLKGFVGGDIVGGAGTAVIGGTVKGNVRLHVDKLYLEPNAVIEGNLTYISSEELDIDSSRVKGEITFQPSTRSEVQANFDQVVNQAKFLFNILKVIYVISYIIIGLILIRIFKKPYQRAARLIEEKPVYSIGLGFGILVGLPIVAVSLMITIIGIPISVLILLAYGVLVYLAQLPVALWLGEKILRDQQRPYVAFVIGSLLIATVKFIPYVGMLGSFVATIAGIGATLIMIKGYYKKEYQEENMILPEE